MKLKDVLHTALIDWLGSITDSKAIGIIGLSFEKNGNIEFFRTPTSWIVNDWENPIYTFSGVNLKEYDYETNHPFFQKLAEQIFISIQTEAVFKNLSIKKGFQFVLSNDFDNSICAILDPLPGNKKPSFNIKKLVKYATERIQHFANENSQETFYAFAIDSGILKMNSIEAFKKDIKAKQAGEYADQYNTAKTLENYKFNPGNFHFEVANFMFDDNGNIEAKTGFSYKLYEIFYDDDNNGRQKSQYLKVMKQVIKKLEDKKVFECLNITDDFCAFVTNGED